MSSDIKKRAKTVTKPNMEYNTFSNYRELSSLLSMKKENNKTSA